MIKGGVKGGPLLGSSARNCYPAQCFRPELPGGPGNIVEAMIPDICCQIGFGIGDAGRGDSDVQRQQQFLQFFSITDIIRVSIGQYVPIIGTSAPNSLFVQLLQC